MLFPLIQKQVSYRRLREFIPNQFNNLIQPEINLLSENLHKAVIMWLSNTYTN